MNQPCVYILYTRCTIKVVENQRINMSGQKNSFIPKSRTIVRIPGTLPSVSSNQLLVSTGIPSIDRFIGGVPVGSVLLVEEDIHRRFSKVLTKCFTAESIVCGHETLIASENEDIPMFIKELPFPSDKLATEPVQSDVKLKIAWRYQTHGNQQNVGTKLFTRYFDLCKTLPPELCNSEDINILDLRSKNTQAFQEKSQSSYDEVLAHVKRKLDSGKYYTGGSNMPKKILRIVIDGMGSPLWTIKTTNPEQEMCRFLYLLKALLRSSFAVAFLSVPTYLFEKYHVERFRRFSDIALRLESFEASEKSSNPLFKEYHGLFHIERLINVNNLASNSNVRENCTDLAFRMNRKHFTVEKLHLPPLLAEDHSQESFCSKKTFGNKSLDF